VPLLQREEPPFPFLTTNVKAVDSSLRSVLKFLPAFRLFGPSPGQPTLAGD
jgi:hypothetical protein